MMNWNESGAAERATAPEDGRAEPAETAVTLAAIRDASGRIAPYVRRTPLVRSRTLSDHLGTNVYLKLEVFQKTGAFKVRGAFSKLLTLPEGERVVAVSGGNHAQAVAYAARRLGQRALILMPKSTPRNSIEATRAYGAETVLTDSMVEAFERIRGYEREGWTFVHPFDDPLVIVGQGSIGLEILEDLPHVTDIILSVGGGGLAGGVGTSVRALVPAARIWGVETEGAESMARALAAGRVVDPMAITSIARTLGAPAVSARTLALAQAHLQGVTVVPDSEALDALEFLLERVKVLTEPAASCTLAAAERLRGQFSRHHHVVLILCGGNVALDDVRPRRAGHSAPRGVRRVGRALGRGGLARTRGRVSAA
jgi:threonine dehydratase